MGATQVTCHPTRVTSHSATTSHSTRATQVTCHPTRATQVTCHPTRVTSHGATQVTSHGTQTPQATLSDVKQVAPIRSVSTTEQEILCATRQVGSVAWRKRN